MACDRSQRDVTPVRPPANGAGNPAGPWLFKCGDFGAPQSRKKSGKGRPLQENTDLGNSGRKFRMRRPGPSADPIPCRRSVQRLMLHSGNIQWQGAAVAPVALRQLPQAGRGSATVKRRYRGLTICGQWFMLHSGNCRRLGRQRHGETQVQRHDALRPVMPTDRTKDRQCPLDINRRLSR